MGLDATARRRWFGAIVLLAALGMLVAGQTVLKDRLNDVVWLVYWLLCLGFTGLAILAALLDARAGLRRVHRQQRDLLETTLKQIETDARTRPRRPQKPGPP